MSSEISQQKQIGLPTPQHKPPGILKRLLSAWKSKHRSTDTPQPLPETPALRRDIGLPEVEKRKRWQEIAHYPLR